VAITAAPSASAIVPAAVPIPEYALYGLTVAIDAPVAGLREAAPGRATDVRVHMQCAPAWSERAVAADGVIYRAGADDAEAPAVDVAWLEGRPGVRLRYGDGTTFHVSANARDAWATWPPSLTLEDTAVYLLGPVMGYVLRRLGVLSLHASAVVIDGRAVAFSGPPGAGKSTTAAACSARGYPVITDDVLALRQQGDAVMAFPAFDHLRLWPDSARMLVGDETRLPLITPTWDKRAFVAGAFGGGVADAPVPLAAIVLLAPREAGDRAPRMERVHGIEALMPVVAETSANYLLDAAMRAAELPMLSHLLARVPVFRLTPNSDPARLPRLVDVVLASLVA